jgi:porin
MPCGLQAQDVNSGAGIGPRQALEETAPSTSPLDSFPKVEHLFGGWGGPRGVLDRHGINLMLDYTSETAGNVSGGSKCDFACADQRTLEIDIDWQKLTGISGLAIHFVAVNVPAPIRCFI